MTKRSSTFVVAALALVIGCGGSAAQNAQPVCPLATTPPVAKDAPIVDELDAMTDEQLVRKLLETTNASSMGKQMADAMLDSFRKMPALPNGFIDHFQKNLKPEALIEIIVPIYLRHYDRKTLIACIRFYRTEPGRRLLAATPTVTTETMEAGKAWGTHLAEKTLKELGPP